LPLSQKVAGEDLPRRDRRSGLARGPDATPVQALQERPELSSSQTHHTVLDIGPTELVVLQTLGVEAMTRTVPEDQLDPVCALGPESLRHGIVR